MSNVHVLPGVERDDLPANAQPRPQVVEFVESILREVKNGDIQSIAVCYVRPSGVTGEGFCVPYDTTVMDAQLLALGITDMFYRHFYHRSSSSEPVTIDPAS